MNTDKTLNDEFIKNTDYPIWYYKKLLEVDISYVICNLLKETFVVEINNSKHQIIFGKNKKGGLGQCIQYDDIKNSKLDSYEVIEKGFKEGKWFIIDSKDTSTEFKDNYRKEKKKYKKYEAKQCYKRILNNIINYNEDLNREQKNKYIEEIESSSFEELEKLINLIFKK